MTVKFCIVLTDMFQQLKVIKKCVKWRLVRYRRKVWHKKYGDDGKENGMHNTKCQIVNDWCRVR